LLILGLFVTSAVRVGLTGTEGYSLFSLVG